MLPARDSINPGPLPLQPLALKIVGDGILAATLVRAGSLPPEDGAMAVVLALGIGFMASAVAGGMLVRMGQRTLWEVASIACLGAMAVLLLVYGAFLVAALLGGLAWMRWSRLIAQPVMGEGAPSDGRES